MSKKIYFPELVDLLVEYTKIEDRGVVENLLKDFFLTIQLGLEEDGIVKVKKLGTFKTATVEARKSVHVNTGEIIEIPGYTKIVFVPDKEIAQAVNFAFAGFETVELDSELSQEQISELNSTDDIVEKNEIKKIEEKSLPTPPPIPVIIKEEKEEPIEIKEEPIVVEQSIDEDNTPQIEPKEEVAEEETKEPSTSIISEEYANAGDIEYEEPESKQSIVFSKGFIIGFVSGALFILVTIIAVSYFIGFPLVINKENENVMGDSIVQTENLANIDSVALEESVVKQNSEPLVPSKLPETKLITDTITKTRYLTTMARQYYGDYNFWVYIYEENKAKIDNPNKIKPGTVMIIPPADKYGINKNDPKSLEQAKEKGYRIYKKYE